MNFFSAVGMHLRFGLLVTTLTKRHWITSKGEEPELLQ